MKKILIGGAVLAALAFGYWTISPLFIDREVDDALPPDATEATGESKTMGDVDTAEDIGTSTDREDATEAAAPTPQAPQLFPIADTPIHPASGNVRIVDAGGETIVRYEEYDGTNGPDLYVYLAKDLDAKEFVSLGRAKGNKGNINYTVPEDVDIADYPYVLTWCQAFGVLFDYAEIR